VKESTSDDATIVKPLHTRHIQHHRVRSTPNIISDRDRTCHAASLSSVATHADKTVATFKVDS
jgi:hypothetical protein